MRKKRVLARVLTLTFLMIIAFAAASTLLIAHNDPLNHVKVYLWSTPNPAFGGGNQFTPSTPGTTVPVFCIIDSPLSWYDTAQGIVAVSASLRVDPNVVTVVGMNPMPDNNWNGRPDSFLGEYTYVIGWAKGVIFSPVIIDPAAGTISQGGEAISDFRTLGKGCGGGPGDPHVIPSGPIPPAVFVFLVTTKTGVDPATAYSALTLYDCKYTLIDPASGVGVDYPVHIVEGGHYGTPPQQYYMSGPPPASFTPARIEEPIGTLWHELYPTYCQEWQLTSHIDNGDGYLSASDQIDMTQLEGTEPGWIYWYHVDAVTVTIHWEFKTSSDPGSVTGEYGAAEIAEYTDRTIENPEGTGWHQIYPEYSKEFVITSWIDNGDGVFSVSDQFDFEYLGEGVIYWAHLTDVTTDIILSFKDKEEPTPEFPLGISLMMAIALAIPVVYVWRRKR